MPDLLRIEEYVALGDSEGSNYYLVEIYPFFIQFCSNPSNSLLFFNIKLIHW